MICFDAKLFWVSGVVGSKNGGQRRIVGVKVSDAGKASVTARVPSLQAGVDVQLTMNVKIVPGVPDGELVPD